MADTDRPFATQYILPMAGIRTGGTANRPAITTRGSLGLFPDDTRTAMPPLPQIGSGAYSRLAATQQPAPYVDAIMRRARGMGALPAGGGLPTPPPAPKSLSLMDRLTPAMGTPAQAGLASAAATGLQLSGYRPVPITTAEGLGAMMQAGMKSYQEAKAAQRPEIKVAGDRLFRVYPDGTTELIGGKMAKPAEVKSEGPRIRTEDGKEIETVYDKFNNLYPAGAAMTEENRISPDSFTVVSQYSEMDVARRTQGRDTLRQSEKAIKTIDRLASEIQKLGPSAFDRIKDEIITSLKSKDPERFGSLSDEEIARQVAAGQLQALVGQARLSLFGPGVLTESEAALARQVFVGGDIITNPEIALNNLWAVRQGFYEDYSEDVDYFNSFRGNKHKKYTGEGKFNWNQYIDADGRVRLTSQKASGGSSAAQKNGATSSGNTWSVM